MKYYSALATALLLLLSVSCVHEKIDFTEPTQPADAGFGYLEFGGMNIIVSNDAENNDDSPEGIQLSEAPDRPAVRTADATDDYEITITQDRTGEDVFIGTYGEVKSRTAPFSLTPGSYTVTAKSPGAPATAAFDAPSYMGKVTANVLKEQTTTVNNLICRLSNLKTTVLISADLNALFKPDDQAADPSEKLVTALTFKGNTLVFGREETRAGYFHASSEPGTLEIAMSGMYNRAASDAAPSYIPIVWKKTIENVKSGQWRKITIRIEHTFDGNVQIVVDVKTWVYDQNIKVDVQTDTFRFAGEEVIPDSTEDLSDPDSPTVVLGNGHRIDEPFEVDASIFNFDDMGQCTDPIEVILTAQGSATLKSIKVVLDSDNETLLARLAATGRADRTIPLYPDNSIGEFATIRNQESQNQTVSILARSIGMQKLYEFTGSHTAKFVAVDSQGRTSYTKLQIRVSKTLESPGPKIVWAGHDLNTRYSTSSLSDNDSVVIQISSETEITGFLIEINSATLTAEELDNLGLARTMNLVDPQTESIDNGLRSLGFKTRDQVRQKYVEFNISQFMPMLGALGPGDTDFKLTVTDAAGTTTRTVMVSVPAI